ncbi:MAG: hypothetical protein A3F82_05290 [Deltaproteobacteria bacterium RIFCSPLOWO2_12_FULL_44_12]|nr:MAG: hypothetical protein A2712_02020 [Deltaproteobacteria bacterium RIFCSPHIGHO2_01_FULL_43_49]OGQ15098.1 MAG: hypothetical protein A3D22_03460 [Deltaproteobacteria bacterium RIFCSPHIGHO2_02_FULL_44_53]OGQ27282.1 MAG: hypothetical protein A3D98_02615 [Deltaproteobacteria bacterium RIFCSPHIGHO2_12_FULL_44_21]OGQ31615.1 MAG: hypothetical protein A2979_04620 [Deltaproteobacteria bacterium RIFCSPLOWO2_01_FULL_45_74]OGQ42815.1 MAG: hypothetical protein A3I70_06925 [Deltaproteobacteria bacterium 
MGVIPHFALSLAPPIIQNPHNVWRGCEKPLGLAFRHACLGTDKTRLVKKSREGCVLRKASRSPFSQTGNKDKMGESRAAILGRPKIDHVFSKNHPGSDFFIISKKYQRAGYR